MDKARFAEDMRWAIAVCEDEDKRKEMKQILDNLEKEKTRLDFLINSKEKEKKKVL